MQSDRLKKVESLVQKEVGLLISMGKIKDPRVTTMITVNRVEVSKDIAYAKVYISSFLGGENDRKAADGLNSASGFIQKQLSAKMKTRNTPKLTFIYDPSIEEGFKVNKTIEENLS